MEIKVTTEQIVREAKTFNIELPFFFHWKCVYEANSESYFDMQDNIWGVVYLTKDIDNEDVIRTTRFKETVNEYYDHDTSMARYNIESDTFDEYRQGKNIEHLIESQCTEEEFNRESTRIFKLITNQ